MVYTCAVCGGTFENDRPDEEAREELREHWGDVPVAECDTVCDDCWRKLPLPRQSKVVLVGTVSV